MHEKFGLPLVSTPDAKVARQANGTYRLKDEFHSGINPFEKVRQDICVCTPGCQITAALCSF